MIDDQEIIQEFADESDEVLERVIADIMELENNLDDEIVSRVFRAFHSVKGSAGMLGFERLGKFAHKAEDVLSLVRTGELAVHKATADLLLHAVDTMRLILNDLRNGGDDGRNADAAMDLLDDTVALAKKAKTAAPKPPVKVETKPLVKIEIAAAETVSEQAEITKGQTKTVPGHDKSPASGTLSDVDHPLAVKLKVVPAMAPHVAPVQETTEGGFVFDLNEKPAETTTPVHVTPLPVSCPPGGGADEPDLKVRPTDNEEFPVRDAPVQAATAVQKTLKILIVEDDFMSRTVLDTFLSRYGNCDIAKDGMEAIYAFTEAYRSDPPQPYDLICMDIIMPIMDGLQASMTIREIERGKGVEGTTLETAIVITSAVDDPATITRACYECGANHYFVKPLDFNQMKRQMLKLGLII